MSYQIIFQKDDRYALKKKHLYAHIKKFPESFFSTNQAFNNHKNCYLYNYTYDEFNIVYEVLRGTVIDIHMYIQNKDILNAFDIYFPVYEKINNNLTKKYIDEINKLNDFICDPNSFMLCPKTLDEYATYKKIFAKTDNIAPYQYIKIITKETNYEILLCYNGYPCVMSNSYHHNDRNRNSETYEGYENSIDDMRYQLISDIAMTFPQKIKVKKYTKQIESFRNDYQLSTPDELKFILYLMNTLVELYGYPYDVSNVEIFGTFADKMPTVSYDNKQEIKNTATMMDALDESNEPNLTGLSYLNVHKESIPIKCNVWFGFVKI